MKINYFPLAGFPGLLLAGAVQATSMNCGTAVISDDQPDGQFKQQILEQCGEPTSKDGDDWLYDRSDVGDGTYILHFDDAEQLDSIEIQMED